MVQPFRTTWNANRHWVAAGFLTSFLLLMFLSWRSELRAMANQHATGLSAIAVSPLPIFLPRSRHQAPVDMARSRSTLGDLPDTVRHVVEEGDVPSAYDADKDDTRRQVIRSGTLEIIAADPLQAAENLRNLAIRVSGFVVNSQVSGSNEQTRSARVTIRIPAERFDEARAQVRQFAISVEEDSVEARDVTREYVNQNATLHNYRAEKAQYLTILKRAAATKDILEISSKLAEVSGRIEALKSRLGGAPRRRTALLPRIRQMVAAPCAAATALVGLAGIND